MTSRLANIAVAARDPARLAEFWCAVLGWTVLEVEDGVISVGADDGSWPVLDLCPDMDAGLDAVPGANRLHLDLRADGSTQAAEVERLLGLGARHADVGQGPDVPWVVLADPEGNAFCVLGRSVADVVADGG